MTESAPTPSVPDAEGVWRVPDVRLARRHRMNIGTIVSDASMSVQFVGGAKIGSVEEGFVVLHIVLVVEPFVVSDNFLFVPHDSIIVPYTTPYVEFCIEGSL